MLIKQILTLFIIVNSLGVGNAQTIDQEIGTANLDQTFEFAQQQIKQGWEDRAQKAYKRVLYFDKQNKYRGQCMEVLASLALKKGHHLEALNYLDQAYFLSNDLLQQNDFQLKRIQIFIETGQIQQALSEIYQIDESFDPERIKVYQAYCQYLLKDFESVESALRGLVEDKKLDHFLLRAAKIERMNPEFYQTMSYVFPGLGQVLLGDFRQSLNSMLLNGGLAVLFINTVKRLSLFDGLISVIPWFYRYYSGGAKLTKQLAIQKKRARHQDNLKRVLNAIR